MLWPLPGCRNIDTPIDDREIIHIHVVALPDQLPIVWVGMLPQRRGDRVNQVLILGYAVLLLQRNPVGRSDR